MSEQYGRALSFGAALFDMDGTLVDSTSLVEQEWRQWAQGKGIDAAEVARSSYGRRTEDVIRQYLPDVDPAAELNRFREMASRLDQSVAGAVPGAVEFVSGIPAGRWAVVTSAPHRIAKVRLLACGFPLPEVLIGADDVRRGKPDPEGFLAAARQVEQAPADCLVFEDAPAGVLAGQRAGMRVVTLETTHPGHSFEGCVQVRDFRSLAVRRAGTNETGQDEMELLVCL
jgi:sugar-phosphatase